MADLSFAVTGGNRAHALAKRLKAFEDKQLEKDLRKAISRALKPATKAVRASVPQYLPSGYAPVLAKALRLRTSNLTSGLRITGQAAGNPRPRKVTDLNRGRLRHPVFGNRDIWVTQTVRPRFFDEPLQTRAPRVRAELDTVLDEVAAKLGG